MNANGWANNFSYYDEVTQLFPPSEALVHGVHLASYYYVQWLGNCVADCPVKKVTTNYFNTRQVINFNLTEILTEKSINFNLTEKLKFS